jgi:hypothetical protein
VHDVWTRRLLRQLAEPPRHRALARTPGPPADPLDAPGEDWWWCYADELFFEIDGAPPSPSHI